MHIIDSINIKILNTGAWAQTKPEHSHISLPKELEDAMSEIEEFYKKKHCGRKLSWAHSWSTGAVRINCLIMYYHNRSLDYLREQSGEIRFGSNDSSNDDSFLLE